jgi:hypothetical protein
MHCQQCQSCPDSSLGPNIYSELIPASMQGLNLVCSDCRGSGANGPKYRVDKTENSTVVLVDGKHMIDPCDTYYVVERK